ncbi:MAG: class I SAM-dependent methyltransferase [Planctomycetaceae bacterium]
MSAEHKTNLASPQRLGTLQSVPENVSFLAAEPSQTFPVCSVDFMWCDRTRHGTISNFQTPDYYLDYLMTTTYSDSMQRLQAAQAARLRSLIESEEGTCSLVEIGCGDGSFLSHAAKHFDHVSGIEPSARFAQEAEAKGFQVLRAYVSENMSPPNQLYDAFVSRQVFEHLPDPLDVLKGIRRMLKKGAVGLIEVPNGERALRLGRFFEFFPDHVNYYSVNSLVDLASRAGFSVIGCHDNFGGDYLELWLRCGQDAQTLFTSMLTTREIVCHSIAWALDQAAIEGKRVAVWGAGAKTLSIFAAMGPESTKPVAFVVDSDPHKHGCYIPNTGTPVVSVPDAVRLSPDVVLILALTYRAEIEHSVRKLFTPVPEILSLDETGNLCSL